MSVIATVVPPVERNCVHDDDDDAWVLLLFVVIVEVVDWSYVKEEVEGGGRAVMDVT